MLDWMYILWNDVTDPKLYKDCMCMEARGKLGARSINPNLIHFSLIFLPRRRIYVHISDLSPAIQVNFGKGSVNKRITEL